MMFWFLILTSLLLSSCANSKYETNETHLTATLNDSPISFSVPNNLLVTKGEAIGTDLKTGESIFIPTLSVGFEKGYPRVDIVKLRNIESLDDYLEKLKRKRVKFIRPTKNTVLSGRKTSHVVFTAVGHLLTSGGGMSLTVLYDEFITQDGKNLYSCRLSTDKLRYEKYKNTAHEICKSIKFGK